MKRVSRSDPPPALISMCAPTEEQKIVYSRELQTMMEGGYEEEEACMVMECGQKKRRLSVDQVKALEKSFDVENKLEPERKQKLAHELGLQPRQVAVWFQNRRARWKTKQLERDYGILKANYDSLKLNLESLQTDNESLINEIRRLRTKLKEENPDADVKEVGLGFEPDIPEPEIAIAAEAEAEALPVMEELNALNQSSQSTDFKDPTPSDSDSSAILNSEEIPKAAAGVEASASAPVFIQHSHSHSHSDEYGNGSGFEFLSLCESTGYNNHMFQVKMEEHNFLGDEDEAAGCSFFSEVEHGPMLHWYTSENWL